MLLPLSSPALLTLNIFHILSLCLSVILIYLLNQTKKPNQLIIALAFDAIIIHIVWLLSWILFDDDPTRIANSGAFCFLQSLMMPYAGLVMHCLILSKILHLWYLLRNGISPIEPTKWIHGSFLLPAFPIAAMGGVVYHMTAGTGFNTTTVVCSIVKPRWTFLIGYSGWAVLLMVPTICLSIHLVYTILHARKYGHDVLARSSITLSVCIRMIILALCIAFFSGLTNIWTIVEVFHSPYLLVWDSEDVTLFEYSLSTIGVALFIVFGTSYEVASVYCNPVRKCFGLDPIVAYPQQKKVVIVTTPYELRYY